MEKDGESKFIMIDLTTKEEIEDADTKDACSTSDLVDRIKKEEIPIEELDQCEMIDVKDQNLFKIEIKNEELGSHEDMDTLDPAIHCDKPSMESVMLDSIKSENAEIYPLQLKEELDIKDETDPSSESAGVESATRMTTAGQNSLTCFNCNYSANSKFSLVRHMTTQHKKSHRLEHTCKPCHKTYKKKCSLDDHVIKHHPDLIDSVTNRIYRCPECDYRTISKNYMATHLWTHSEFRKFRPFKCSQCHEVFRTAAAIYDHMFKSHPDSISSNSRETLACQMCRFKTTRA
ncbi:unnamed protein product [Acanthoscelides obtectus]|uniref:C2H2-type domain-containing protein n=1 Tax=Acanthoscelides obtectus TaxID=200917 RepID=A0A9P0LRZ7_ACAOB|nr:unnamed protein product [Acanthoscelides obtectus]CAK1675528.1 Zinc finger protein ZFAT [Acanthoscelides obtectus]